MVISKEEFCEIISDLKEAYRLQSAVNELFGKSKDNIKNDFCNAGSLQISHESIVVKLLEVIFENDNISYFIYELDYGERYKPGSVTEIIDGKRENIDFSTPEKLYDYLTTRRR